MSVPCPKCGEINAPGWESLSGTFERACLQRVGTLRSSEEVEPTLREHHPNGTHGWSPLAPIALAYHPYNRSDVWQCKTCGRAYLRYTEYGGYYQDERIRLLNPELVDATKAPAD